MTRLFPLATAAFLLSTGSAVADDSPNAVIEEAVTLLAEQLDGRKEELTENREPLYEIIDGILLPRFDRRFAAQLVLARHWREASPEQQQRFIEAFYQALLRKYSDGILEFDPDKITVLPFRGDTSKNRSKVRSTVDLLATITSEPSDGVCWCSTAALGCEITLDTTHTAEGGCATSNDEPARR